VNAQSEEARCLFASPCEFVFGGTDSLPESTLPEVAFVGRSNVGKSSLINALTNRKTLARVSQTPGRTRQINFFGLGGRLMLVDLPGYGFAKASRAEAEQWQRSIFAYLAGRTSLQRVVLLIDARRGIMDSDEQAMALLDKAAVSYVAVLTKIDTVKPAGLAATQQAVEVALKSHAAAYPAIFAVSARDGTGLDDLRLHIAAMAERR
jgi:GTP-binding protein